MSRVHWQAKALGGPFRSDAYDPLLAEQKMRERDERRGGVEGRTGGDGAAASVESRDEEWAAELDAEDCMYRTYSGWKGWQEEGRGDYYDTSCRRHQQVLSEMFVRYPEAFLTPAALDKYSEALAVHRQRLAQQAQAAARHQVPRSDVARSFDEFERKVMRWAYEEDADKLPASNWSEAGV